MIPLRVIFHGRAYKEVAQVISWECDNPDCRYKRAKERVALRKVG